MKNPPFVSIVVPSFKTEATIARTLQSLVDQDYPRLQIIVIDGGSPDGTAHAVEPFLPHLDVWLSEPDRGQTHALNKGFRIADGDLYGWLCADDQLEPGAIWRLVEEFARRPEADLITGGCRRDFNGAFEVITAPDPRFAERLAFVNTIEQPSTLWRAELHHTAGPLDESYRYAMDWEFWRRMQAKGGVFRSVPEVLSTYYFSDDNLTSSGGRKIADEMARIIKTYGPYNGRLARIYQSLYKRFDLKGFYDPDAAERISGWRRAWHHMVLRWLYWRYDRETIDAYNWNFCSRLERGLGWS
ncbi:MAG: glycosyltransferase family 2 protein [Maricaulaceae bacterium]